MKRNIAFIATCWLVLTALLEAVAWQWSPFPTPAAIEAHIIDNAFRLLVLLSVPVLTFVVVMLTYSLLRFRVRGEPRADGWPLRSHTGVVVTWLAATTGLTGLVIVHPGITGMMELMHHAEHEPAMTVRVEGMRWVWRIQYPEQDIATTKELVLPVGKHVRFEITALDVLHSFWVPAFRMKVDAVPGRVTVIDVTPDRLGDFSDASAFRLQCAELCGLGHGAMNVHVRVVSEEEFAEWLVQQRSIK